MESPDISVYSNILRVNVKLFPFQRDRQHQQSHVAMAVCTEREAQQNVLSSETYSTISYTGMFVFRDPPITFQTSVPLRDTKAFLQM